MTDSTDATSAGEEARRLCAYCHKPGVDCCIGMTASASGPDHAVYAHGVCAAGEGVPILYRLLPPADICAVCREPGATIAAPLVLGSPRYVHAGCAAAEASASGGGQ